MSTREQIRQQIIDNQEEMLRNQEQMLSNESFFEHLTDHLIIATSFFTLGIFVCISMFYHLYREKVRVDYDIEEGTIMRMERKNGKRLLIVRPASLIQFYDMILLSFFDRGKSEYIYEHDTKRLRAMRNIGLVLMPVIILSGILLILSAAEFSMNPFDYIFK